MVERNLAKVEVESSRLFSRSRIRETGKSVTTFPFLISACLICTRLPPECLAELHEMLRFATFIPFLRLSLDMPDSSRLGGSASPPFRFACGIPISRYRRLAVPASRYAFLHVSSFAKWPANGRHWAEYKSIRHFAAGRSLGRRGSLAGGATICGLSGITILLKWF